MDIVHILVSITSEYVTLSSTKKGFKFPVWWYWLSYFNSQVTIHHLVTEDFIYLPVLKVWQQPRSCS